MGNTIRRTIEIALRNSINSSMQCLVIDTKVVSL
jgi:hypothetical protein